MEDAEFKQKQIELLEKISKSINDVNIKTDKMIILLKKATERFEKL